MNSIHTIFLLAILFCCLGVSTNAIYATGGLDDEEEEEAITNLQNDVGKINEKLDAINLNLESGPNAISANCPSTEQIVEEVVQNLTNNTATVTPPPPPEEPAPTTGGPTCPFVPVPPATEPEAQPPLNTVLPPVEGAEPQQQNLTCPFAPTTEPEPITPTENVTEQVEDIIEDVVQSCNLPINLAQDFIPGIILPEINETIVAEEEEPAALPPHNDLTCPFMQQMQEQNTPVVNEEQGLAQQLEELDQTPVATIEFDTSCGCFVVDKTPLDIPPVE